MTSVTALVVSGAVVFIALTGAGIWLRPRLALRLSGIDSDGAPRVMGTLRTQRPGGGLGSFVRPYLGPLTITVLLALLNALLALAAPWPMKIIVDNALGRNALPNALPLVGGMKGLGVVHLAVFLGVGLVAAAALVSYLVSYLVGTISLNISADLRVTVFDRLLHLPVLVHDRHRSGDLVTRLTSDVSRVQEALVARVQVLVPGLATMIGMTTLMLLLDPLLALVVLAAVPPLAVLAVLRQRAAPVVSDHVHRLAADLGVQQRCQLGDQRTDVEGAVVDRPAQSGQIGGQYPPPVRQSRREVTKADGGLRNAVQEQHRRSVPASLRSEQKAGVGHGSCPHGHR